MIRNKLAAAFLASFCIAAAAADAVSPVASASEGTPQKLEYARTKTKIIGGDKIGYLTFGWFCNGGRDMKAADRIEEVFNFEIDLAFKKATRDLHLALATRDVSAFDSAAPSDADYRIGGVVTNVDNQVCLDGNSRKGSFNADVKWDLFSTRLQRVVLSRTTSGVFSLKESSTMSARDFEVAGFASALTNFFNDPDVKLLLNGAAPAPSATALAPLHVLSSGLASGPTAQNTDALKRAVVTISSDASMGSGFYVANGYVLTNRHVVGSAKYVKVKLSTGKELVGEVIREDGPRDVALIKTEVADVPTIHLRLTEPVVGEEAWAIGSPLSQQLAGTVTRGVLSGVRETEGVRFLQSDVAINPGNSGGPLIDGQGNAIGLATIKVANAAGLGFFVPVRDAVDKLALVIDPAPPVVPETVVTTVTTKTTAASVPPATKKK